MIEMKDARVEYAHGTVFSYPNIKFEKGKITSVIGRNGSGKSTLLKVIAGMNHYLGSVKIDGKECSTLSVRERARRAAYLPQNLKNANMDVEALPVTRTRTCEV